MRLRLARGGGCGYAAGMTALRIFSIVLVASFAACETPHQAPPKKAAKRSSNARSGVKEVGRKTEKTFRGIGGTLEKFFTGHDTISR